MGCCWAVGSGVMRVVVVKNDGWGDNWGDNGRGYNGRGYHGPEDSGDEVLGGCSSELVKNQGNCSYVRNCVLLLPCVERAWSIERLSKVVILQTFPIV